MSPTNPKLPCDIHFFIFGIRCGIYFNPSQCCDSTRMTYSHKINCSLKLYFTFTVQTSYVQCVPYNYPPNNLSHLNTHIMSITKLPKFSFFFFFFFFNNLFLRSIWLEGWKSGRMKKQEDIKKFIFSPFYLVGSGKVEELELEKQKDGKNDFE